MVDSYKFSYSELTAQLTKLLIHYFDNGKASRLALLFTEAEFDGIKTHGLKRFPRFIDEIKNGWIKPANEPEIEFQSDAWRVINGHQAAGPLNAVFALENAMSLARNHAVGLVGLNNTNHWLRPGYYAKLATHENLALICWTNTIPNMKAHGGEAATLGNNPIVFGLPAEPDPIILDTALSQFSYGKIQDFMESGEPLPVPGGYDSAGEPSRDAKLIFESLSASAIGWWKGAGLSIMLDLMAALLCKGQSVNEIGRRPGEQDVSQVFIAVDIKRLWANDYSQRMNELREQLISAGLHLPGQTLAATRKKHEQHGVTVDADTWQAVLNTA